MTTTRRTFSLWVIPAALAIGIGLFALLVAGASFLRPVPAVAKNGTAVMTVIFAPTSTPVLPTLATTPTATPGPGETTVGGISTGIYVQISGTGGDGLRLRREPGTGADVMFMGYEAEVFKVVDGPRDADGYVWWYLTAPYDANRSGWAASNYLTVIELSP